MRMNQSENGEVFIDIVSPQGDERATVDWVAKELLKQGWVLKENKNIEKPIIKQETQDGKENS
ncbi:MAG: hypothetical protein HKK66_03205 [Chlorobiaceae bacterium]|nr:hypothetical protein [Chlorobiaceae bacterium]